MAYEIVSRNGFLVDSASAPSKRGDLTVAGKRITAMGQRSLTTLRS